MNLTSQEKIIIDDGEFFRFAEELMRDNKNKQNNKKLSLKWEEFSKYLTKKEFFELKNMINTID